MPTRPRTFIFANNDRFNTDNVVGFGDRKYIFRDRRSPFNVDDIIIDVWAKLIEEKFDPENDFIVLTGPMISVAVLLIAISSRYPRFKLLMFDAAQSKYRERIIDTQAFAEKACPINPS